MVQGFEELWKKLDYLIIYGFHANDVNHNDFEDDIKFAFEKFAKLNGLPEPKWGDEECYDTDESGETVESPDGG